MAVYEPAIVVETPFGNSDNSGETMSHFCKTHIRYEAKREPNSLCGECWRLWFYRNPESKAGLQREWQEFQAEMECEP